MFFDSDHYSISLFPRCQRGGGPDLTHHIFRLHSFITHTFCAFFSSIFEYCLQIDYAIRSRTRLLRTLFMLCRFGWNEESLYISQQQSQSQLWMWPYQIFLIFIKLPHIRPRRSRSNVFQIRNNSPQRRLKNQRQASSLQGRIFLRCPITAETVYQVLRSELAHRSQQRIAKYLYGLIYFWILVLTCCVRPNGSQQ